MFLEIRALIQKEQTNLLSALAKSISLQNKHVFGSNQTMKTIKNLFGENFSLKSQETKLSEILDRARI